MLLHYYFISFNFFRNGEPSRNQIGRSGVQVKKENKKFTVVCSRSPQNLEFVHFTLLFCREWPRKVPKFKTHVQSDCFCSLNLLFYGVVVVVAVVSFVLKQIVSKVTFYISAWCTVVAAKYRLVEPPELEFSAPCRILRAFKRAWIVRNSNLTKRMDELRLVKKLNQV